MIIPQAIRNPGPALHLDITAAEALTKAAGLKIQGQGPTALIPGHQNQTVRQPTQELLLPGHQPVAQATVGRQTVVQVIAGHHQVAAVVQVQAIVAHQAAAVVRVQAIVAPLAAAVVLVQAIAEDPDHQEVVVHQVQGLQEVAVQVAPDRLLPQDQEDKQTISSGYLNLNIQKQNSCKSSVP